MVAAYFLNSESKGREMQTLDFPTTNWHGQTIRCEDYPLETGDSFEVFSCQIYGQSPDYCGLIVPARYTIIEADENSVLIKRPKSESLYRVNGLSVRAILGEWSEYKKSRIDK